ARQNPYAGELEVEPVSVPLPEGEELIQPEAPQDDKDDIIRQTLTELGLTQLIPPDLDPAAPHGGSDNEVGGSGEETPAGIVSVVDQPVPKFEDTHYPRRPEEPAKDPKDVLIDDLRTKLQESETMRKQVVEANDKVILRNRELEQENATLKAQLEELQAKLAQYEGIA